MKINEAKRALSELSDKDQKNTMFYILLKKQMEDADKHFQFRKWTGTVINGCVSFVLIVGLFVGAAWFLKLLLRILGIIS